MSLKDNFRQVARDLLLGEEVPSEWSVTPEEINDMFEEMKVKAVGRQPIGQTEYEEASAEEVVPEHSKAIPLMPSLAAPRRKTVIAEGTVIHGHVDAKGGIEIFGELQGDLVCEEDIQISGKLVGDSKSRNIELCGGRMQGSIAASSRVQMDDDSVLLGDVQAGELSLRGKIKGNLCVSEVVTLEGHAVVLGDIVARQLHIADGAALHGQVKIAFRDLGAMFAENI